MVPIEKTAVTNTTSTRSYKRFVSALISSVVLLVSLWLIYDVSKDVVQTFFLHREVQIAQEQFDELSKENEKLGTLKDKLTDPDYVKNYARGKYLISSQGEQTFYVPTE